MGLPPVEPLFEHLCALRDAPDPTDPRHDARWRAIARWLALAFPGTSTELQDARQEALISLVRHVKEMRAEAPLQAAKWLSTIVKRKRVDALRARSRDPVQKALATERRQGDLPPIVDRLEAEDGSHPTPEMLAQIVTTVLEHVHRALEETEPHAGKRQLRRTQALATLQRLVCGADGEEIERLLDLGEPIGKDRLYKWIERGRPVVHLGLDRWERSAEGDDVAPIVAILREIVDERRVDAGVPRPDRRKEHPEEGP